MGEFSFTELDISGVYRIDSFFAGDGRGFFEKNFEKRIFREAGIDFEVDESFTSLSMKNVMRGLHFQLHSPQAKLVKVISGRVWDVVVDLRIDSPTYKKWTAMELSSDNHVGLYIPAFFAHGFLTLEDNTVMLYQCDGEYDRSSDSGIRCDDPEIGIEWPIDREKAICSERDLKLPFLCEYEKNPMKQF